MGRIEPKEFVLKDGRKGIIRTAEEADAENLLNYLNQVMKDECFFIMTMEDIKEQGLTIEKEKEWIQKHNKEGSIAIVAEINDNIAGLVHVINSPLKRLNHVGVLAVSILEQYRNNGLGSLLMEMIMEWAEKNTILEKIALAVFDNNPRAIQLYHKFGFVEEGRKVKEIKFSIDHYVDSILMYKFVK